jgi:hypothetical protein
MRSVSLQYVPTAILSRQTAGLRGSSLIVNLPGKPKSIKECLDAVFPAIPYDEHQIDFLIRQETEQPLRKKETEPAQKLASTGLEMMKKELSLPQKAPHLKLKQQKLTAKCLQLQDKKISPH